MAAWIHNQADQDMIARDLKNFLPDRIFDAHAHLVHFDHFAPNPVPAYLQGNPEAIGIETYRKQIEWLHPNNRTVGGLFFGIAFNGDRHGNNDFIASEVVQAQQQGFNALGQMIIAPDDDIDWVREQVKQHGYVGLKCYHTLATGLDIPTWLAPLEAYLPEKFAALADELGLSITLHMVRDRALADPVNQASIRGYCERYPNMRMILAHAGRGFNPWHTIEGIHSMSGLDNVWFDTSAITDSGAFEAIINTIGHHKLMYGTDFFVSHMRGRSVAIGDSFHWLYAEELTVANHTVLQPVLIGLESLRTLRLACYNTKLNDSQVEDIFYNNAARLFSFQSK